MAQKLIILRQIVLKTGFWQGAERELTHEVMGHIRLPGRLRFCPKPAQKTVRGHDINEIQAGPLLIMLSSRPVHNHKTQAAACRFVKTRELLRIQPRPELSEQKICLGHKSIDHATATPTISLAAQSSAPGA